MSNAYVGEEEAGSAPRSAQEGAKLRLFFPRLLCANAHQVQSFYLFRKLIGVDKCVAVEIGGGS